MVAERQRGQRASVPPVPKERRSVRMQIDNAKSRSPTLTATHKVKVRGFTAAGLTPSRSGRDPQFAQFYRSLDAYKAGLREK
jgi:hypothetical protein